MLAILWQELRAAARGLIRSPWFTLTAVLTLSIGLGLAMFMFSAVQSLVLRPPPFERGGQLMHIEYADAATQDDSIEIPTGDFLTLRRAQTQFAAFEAFSQGTVSLSGDGRPERYHGGFVTPTSFATLGIAPMLGPGFVEGDDRPGAPLKVVLSYPVWQQRYAADPAIIGQTIRANGKPASVVGVMPRGFAFPFNNQVWLPLHTDVATTPRRKQSTLEVWGRFAENATPASATAGLNALLGRIEAEDTGEPLADSVIVKTYKDEFAGKQMKQTVGTMFAAVLLVLVIACVNVANLMVARSVRRQRETAIRNAIGASRWRMVWAGLAEAALICLLAAAIGFVFAQIGAEITMEAVRSSEDPPPYWMTEIRVDTVSVLFAMAVAAFATLLAGLWPAWRAAQIASAQAMREGGNGSVGGRMGHGLTTAEIALCIVLLVTSGLTVRSVIERERIDLNFNADRVLSGRIGLFDTTYPGHADLVRFSESLQQRLSALPGVAAVGITNSVPFSYAVASPIQLEAQDANTEARLPYVLTVSADPGYFASLEIPLLHGRLIEPRDKAGAPRVAVLSSALAERFWPGQDPLGQRFRLGRGAELPWIEVVGVVPHVPQIGDDVEDAALYLPFAQASTRFFSFTVRTEGDPSLAAEAVREAVVAVDPDLAVYWLRSLREWVDLAAFDQRLFAALFGMFGVFAMLLAAAGLYAVLAYQVSQRTREIGVRRALGADNRGIVRMVLQQGLWQLGIGVGVGVLLALGFAQLLSNLLFGVSAHDPLTYAGVVALLALVAMLAALVPTRRALGVAPMVALRYE